MNETLATEMLREIKASAKRWFIIAIIELGIIIAITVGFLWYLSLPVDEVMIDNDNGNANYIGRDLNGGILNGENFGEEESGKK